MALWLPLVLRGSFIKAEETHKLLGVMFDWELRWDCQAAYNIAKALNWVLVFRWLAWPSTGVSLRLMRQLYLAIAVLKWQMCGTSQHTTWKGGKGVAVQ